MQSQQTNDVSSPHKAHLFGWGDLLRHLQHLSWLLTVLFMFVGKNLHVTHSTHHYKRHFLWEKFPTRTARRPFLKLKFLKTNGWSLKSLKMSLKGRGNKYIDPNQLLTPAKWRLLKPLCLEFMQNFSQVFIQSPRWKTEAPRKKGSSPVLPTKKTHGLLLAWICLVHDFVVPDSMQHGIHHHEFHQHLGRKIFCRIFGSPTAVAVANPKLVFMGVTVFTWKTAVATLISINLKRRGGVQCWVGMKQCFFWWSLGRVKGSNFEVH